MGPIVFDKVADQEDFLVWLDDVLKYLTDNADIDYDEGVFVPNHAAALASEFENRYEKIIKLAVDNKTQSK